MVQLTAKTHNALQAHYGDGCLSKALQDISVNKHDAKAFQIVAKHHPDTFLIGENITPTQDDVDSVWNSIASYVKELYRISADAFKYIVWKVVVEAGSVPIYLEPLINNLTKIASATGRYLVKIANKVAEKIADVWTYLSKLLNLSGTTLSPTQQRAVDQSKAETFNFSSLISVSMAAVKYVIRSLASSFLFILTTVRDVIYSGIRIMSDVAFSTMESAFKTIDVVKREVVETSFLLLVTTGDMLPSMRQPTNFLNQRLFQIARRFATQFERLYKQLKQAIGSNAFVKALQNTWLFNASYGAFLKGVDIFNWIISHLMWLVSAIIRVPSSASHFFFNLMFAGPFMDQIIGDFMRNTGTAFKQSVEKSEGIVNVAQKCKDLSVRKSMSSSAKTLQQVAAVTDTLISEHAEFEQKRISSEQDKPIKEVFQDYDNVARMLTMLYFDEKPSTKDVDQLYKRRMGYGVFDFISITSDAKQLMHIEYLRAFGTALELQKQQDQQFLRLGKLMNTNIIVDQYEPIGIRTKEELSKLTTEKLFAEFNKAQINIDVRNEALRRTEVLLGIDERSKKYVGAVLNIEKERNKNREKSEQLEQDTEERAIITVKDIDNVALAFLDVKRDKSELLKDIYDLLDEHAELKIIAEIINTRIEKSSEWKYWTSFLILLPIGYTTGTLLYSYVYIPFATAYESYASIGPSSESWWDSIKSATGSLATFSGFSPFQIFNTFNPNEWIRQADNLFGVTGGTQSASQAIAFSKLVQMLKIAVQAAKIGKRIFVLTWTTLCLPVFIIIDKLVHGGYMSKFAKIMVAKLAQQAEDDINKSIRESANLLNSVWDDQRARSAAVLNFATGIFSGGGALAGLAGSAKKMLTFQGRIDNIPVIQLAHEAEKEKKLKVLELTEILTGAKELDFKEAADLLTKRANQNNDIRRLENIPSEEEEPEEDPFAMVEWTDTVNTKLCTTCKLQLPEDRILLDACSDLCASLCH